MESTDGVYTLMIKTLLAVIVINEQVSLATNIVFFRGGVT